MKLFFAVLFAMLSLQQLLAQGCSDATVLIETETNIPATAIPCESGSSTFYAYFSPNATYYNEWVSVFSRKGTGAGDAFTVKLYGPFENLSTGCLALNPANLIYEGPSIAYSYASIGSVEADSLVFGKVYIIKVILSGCGNTLALGHGDVNIFQPEISCSDCLPRFNPPVGKYVLSAWVKEDGVSPLVTSYTNPSIKVVHPNASTNEQFYPSGSIIDGWQKIEGIFSIPSDGDFELQLLTASGTAYFDDIRIHPFNSSMITYVYDPLTLRLIAELDERNYAKIYEYDEEGKLIRIKKETEKGIMTIQETRENTFKQ